MENVLPVSELSAVRTRLTFVSEQPVHLPRFAGSAWRGAFGHALRRMVCALRQPKCGGCPLYGVCAYPGIFDPPPLAGQQGSAADITPVPYVLAPEPGPAEGVYPPGAPIVVTLRLFGKAGQLAGYAVAALCEAAAGGIGPARAPLRVAALNAEESDAGAALSVRPATPTTPILLSPPPPPNGATRITLLTPMRLRLGGDLVTPQRLTPADLFGMAVRRVAAIRRIHGGLTDTIDFRALKQAAQGLRWDASRLYWTETARRSSRQHMLMQFGGVMGELRVDLRATPGLWPFLWLSQWLHVGKGASMGFGQIRVDEV